MPRVNNNNIKTTINININNNQGEKRLPGCDATKRCDGGIPNKTGRRMRRHAEKHT